MDELKKKILAISGERIRRARILKGLTQKELAAKVGYSDSTTIYKIEKGLQDIPTSKIKQLCKVLDIDFNYLKGDVDYILDNGKPIVFEYHTIDDRRARLMNEATDLMNKATESQLKKIIGILTVLVSGDDSGDADL